MAIVVVSVVVVTKEVADVDAAVVGATVVVQPSHITASTLSSTKQVVSLPTTTSLDRCLVPSSESWQPAVQPLHKLHSVPTNLQGHAWALQTSSVVSFPLVQELPLPLMTRPCYMNYCYYFYLTTSLERSLVPPAQVTVHALHSVQAVPMCLQLPEEKKLNVTEMVVERKLVLLRQTLFPFAKVLSCDGAEPMLI